MSLKGDDGIVQRQIRGVADACVAARELVLADLNGEADLKARQEKVRGVCQEIIGPFPERTPLREKVIHRLELDAHDIELLTFESRPGLIVTANLYLPVEGEGPFPVVVCLVGHWVEGKAHGDHQRLARLMARHGVAVLVLDSAGQGERIQLYDVTMRRSWIGSSVAHEHTQLGNLMLLTGHHPANLMLWDVVRALDLLEKRSDIDSSRMGITGACCGATLTRYLCALESRLSAAAAVVDAEQLDPLGGGDTEQNLFGALAQGITPTDQFESFAPKPLMLTSTLQESESEAFVGQVKEVEAWYDRMGAADQLEVFSAEGQHGYFRAARARTALFFARTFGLDVKRVREAEMPVEKPQRLFCTETGQISNSLKSEDWFSWHQAQLASIQVEVAVPNDESGVREFRDRFLEKIHKQLCLPEPLTPVVAEVESHSTDWGLSVEKGRLVVEDGIFLPYSFYSAATTQERRSARPTVLALHERGLSMIAAQGPWMKRMAAGGHNIMAIDVRGVGETRLQSNREARDPYRALLLGAEAQWARRALNVGMNLFGCRVFDVLRTLTYLRSRWELKSNQISMVGVGRGALWALYAAAIDEKVERTVLLRGLTSYRSLAVNHRHNHHFSLYLSGVLRDFDLLHVAACVAPRKLTLLNPVQQRRERRGTAEVKLEYELTRSCYEKLGVEDKFSILTRDSAPETLIALADGLGLEAEPGGWDQWLG